MSLTSFLKNKDVKEKFKEEFPKPRFSSKKEMLAPPLTSNYPLVGIAFDYLMRFKLELINSNAITTSWVAQNTLIIAKRNNSKELYKEAKKIIENARLELLLYKKNGNIDNCEGLLEYALLLAQLDFFYRSGRIYENLGYIEDKDIDDLRNLISIVDPEQFKSKHTCILNPTFGDASALVGGADADFILDDMLIDIKTTKRLQLPREHFDQLIGYYSLYKIGAVQGLQPEHGIEKLGIYFSRHAYLYLIDIHDVINENKFKKFLEWFENRAIQEYYI